MPHTGHFSSAVFGCVLDQANEIMQTTFDNYIAGEWTAGVSLTPNRNPSNLADVIGEYAQADAEQAKAAIAAAARAFPAWAIGSIPERANGSHKVGTENTDR